MIEIRPFLVAVLFVALLPSVDVLGQLVLTAPDTAPCPIVYEQNAPGADKAAAKLAGYLGKMAGVEFPVSPVGDELPARVVVLGLPGGDRSPDLGRDGYVLRTDGQRLHIRAGSSAGMHYGVYGLLEDYLGCRWWSHNEEDVPTNKTVRLSDIDQVVTPPFSLHNLFNREAQNRANDFALKSRSTSGESFTGSHTLYRLLNAHGQTHPEIYPMGKDGSRKPNKLHFCYMAPGIAEALAEALAAQVERDPAALPNKIYFAGMGDWYGGMCQCDVCKSIYAEETWTDPDGRKKAGYTATLLRMINRTGEILEKQYPGIRVGTFAYMSLEAPPALTVPRHNVVIRVPRLRHCTVHASDECDKNSSFLRNLERWGEVAPGRVYIWDYGTNFKSFLYPFPCVRSIAGNIKLYKRMHVAGVMVQGNYVTTGSDLVVLKNYVWRKLMWDPDRDPDAVIREFCEGYFGPAAEPMLAYVGALEAGVRLPSPIHADEFAKPGYLTPEVRERLSILRREAIAATGGGAPHLRRVKEATVGIEVLSLDVRRPFVELGDSLAPEGFDAATLPRALDAIAHVRNSGCNEWTTGHSYWLDFVRRQGGPLVTLRQGPVTVQVAPLLNGQIRRIQYAGTNLLYVSAEPVAQKAQPVGGSIVTMGGTLMTVVGEATATQVTMEDALEIPGWRFSKRPTVTKRVTLDADGVITVTAGPDEGAKAPSARVTTVFRAEGDVRVSFRSGMDEWSEVTLAPSGEEAIVPELSELRIVLPSLKLTVLDRTIAPVTVAAQFVRDTKAGTLTIVIEAGPLGAAEGLEDGLLREIEVLPQVSF